jgi:Pyruvate/2-oxoacid:ferredoxin oxidoreductase delta subunit
MVNYCQRSQFDQDLMMYQAPTWSAKLMRIKYATAWQNKWAAEPPLNDVFLKQLESIRGNKYSTAFTTNLVADLTHLNLLRIFNLHSIYGENKRVEQLLGEYLARRKRNEVHAALTSRTLAANNELNIYKQIIEKKFGKQFIAQLATKLKVDVTKRNVEGLLSELKPAERKAVELEFNRRKKFQESIQNNSCPHVKLYRKLRAAVDIYDMKRLYGELSEFFESKTASDKIASDKVSSNKMIQCKNCKFDILCPHALINIEDEMNQTHFSEHRAKLNDFIDNTNVRGFMFCKVCGELISANLQLDVDHVSMDEELKNIIWAEFASLMRYIKFGQLVNVGSLINSMRDYCYPFIYDIEKQIIKSRTNTAEEIRAKRKLFIAIYGMAYLIHLVMSNARGDVQIAFKGVKATPRDKNAIVEYIKHVIELIINSRNVTIREIPNMTNDIIKSKLIEAFKSISIVSQKIEQSVPRDDALIALVLSATYSYIYNINVLDELLGGKNLRRDKYDFIDQIENYMGRAPDKLTGETYYKYVHRPKFDAKWHTREFDEIKADNDAIVNWRRVYPGYMAASFKMFMSRIVDLSDPIFTTETNSKDIDLGIKLTSSYIKMRDEFAEFASREQKVLESIRFSHMKNFWAYDHTGRRRFDAQKLPLGRMYDEEGQPHSWNVIKDEYGVVIKTTPIIYICEIAGETKEFTLKDINALTAKNQQFDGRIVDRKCGTCSVLYSATDTLDEKKIIDSLESQQSVKNFYRFYENRCPKGQLHEFAQGKCTKCAMIMKFFAEPTSKEAIAVYKTYRKVYMVESAESRSIVLTSAQMPEMKTYQYDAWSPNFNTIVDLCSRLKINQKLLVCLGATEKQPYMDIESGSFIPPETEHKTDTRIYRIISYINELMTGYNTLRFYGQIDKPTLTQSLIGEIIAASNMRDKLGELAKSLPDIYDEVQQRITYFSTTHKPREIVDFCVQYFTELCLRILDTGGADTEKIRSEFVKFIVKRILRADEMITKPGYFNWSMIYGDDVIVEKDMNATDDNDVVDDDDDDENNDYGDTSKPLAAADLDVEDDDATGEDDSNQVRVGEDLGLM